MIFLRFSSLSPFSKKSIITMWHRDNFIRRKFVHRDYFFFELISMDNKFIRTSSQYGINPSRYFTQKRLSFTTMQNRIMLGHVNSISHSSTQPHIERIPWMIIHNVNDVRFVFFDFEKQRNVMPKQQRI